MRHQWSVGVAIVAVSLVGCGGEPGVASKSAQAYREAEAKGVNVGEPRNASAPGTAATATAHDAHAGMDHGDQTSSGAATPADHAAMGHGAASGAVDHSAHGGATATDHAAMGHGATSAGHAGHSPARGATAAVDHAAMGHAPTSNSAAHAGHGAASRGASGALDHSAMGHSAAGHSTAGHATTGRGASSAATDHAGHRATAARTTATADHAAMGHGTAAPATPDHSTHSTTPRAAAAADAHAAMGHTDRPATDHAAHAATGATTGAATQTDPHAAHRSGASPVADRVVIAAPQTNAALRKLQPGATLQPDVFDAARPAPVAEAAKAREPMDHSGHTRGITAGEDEANPPTPMPATRDGEAFRGESAPPAAGHDHAAGASAAPAAEAMYSCPMHPEITSDKPGTCPKCGMALVKKK